MKEKKIRFDIADATISSFSLNKLFSSFEKANSLNKIIYNQAGHDITSSYKRASNILDGELKNNKIEIADTTDPGIFKNDFEKDFYKKTNELRKYFSTISKNHNFDEALVVMSTVKKEVFAFFDNVKVNDNSETVKKNRLELINFFCKTYENFIDFQLIKDINE